MFDWYRIFKISEFDALNLVSRTYVVELQDIGVREIFVSKGVGYNILYDGVFLCLKLNDKNPYVKDGYAIYRNPDGYVYLGIATDES